MSGLLFDGSLAEDAVNYFSDTSKLQLLLRNIEAHNYHPILRLKHHVQFEVHPCGVLLLQGFFLRQSL